MLATMPVAITSSSGNAFCVKVKILLRDKKERT